MGDPDIDGWLETLSPEIGCKLDDSLKITAYKPRNGRLLNGLDKITCVLYFVDILIIYLYIIYANSYMRMLLVKIINIESAETNENTIIHG